MKIAIDASQLVYQTGVSFYTANLIKALSQIDKQDEFLVFGSSFRLKKKLENEIKRLRLSPNFKPKIFPLPPSFFEFFWNRLHLTKLKNFTGRVDIFHSSDWTQPPVKKAKIVATIHDLAVFRYPEYFPARILINQRLKLKWVQKEADAVIAVSQATKKDIVKFLKIAPQKIKVIYEAVPLEHQLKINLNELKRLKHKYGLSKYFLFVGTREPRKNIKRVIEAFKMIKNSKTKDLQLVIVGKKGWGKESFKIQNSKFKIKLLNQVSNKELLILYSGAECFIYPSLYEGFGLPVLEAMNYGCPVITSNVSSLPEVAGRAAIMVDPLNVREIAGAIKKVINDKNLSQKLRKKGLVQAKKFSWKKTAEQTLAVYQSLIN